jgi:hypothetical protein
MFSATPAGVRRVFWRVAGVILVQRHLARVNIRALAPEDLGLLITGSRQKSERPSFTSSARWLRVCPPSLGIIPSPMKEADAQSVLQRAYEAYPPASARELSLTIAHSALGYMTPEEGN